MATSLAESGVGEVGVAVKKLHMMGILTRVRRFNPADQLSRGLHKMRQHILDYLIEGFVAQTTQLYKVGEAERAILDNKAQQLGEGFKETLQTEGNTSHI